MIHHNCFENLSCWGLKAQNDLKINFIIFNKEWPTKCPIQKIQGFNWKIIITEYNFFLKINRTQSIGILKIYKEKEGSL